MTDRTPARTRTATSRLTRAALAGVLLTLLLVGPLTGPNAARPVLVDAETAVDAVARTLAGTSPGGMSPPLVYEDARPPSGALAAVLAGAAAGPGVTLRVPGTPAPLRLVAPDRPVAGRRTTLDLTVRGTPETAKRLTLESSSGMTDTLEVRIGPSGISRTRVAVEPTRDGAASWTVRADGHEVVARAWVQPASPVRVLVLTGPPSVESRHLVRALEAAGMAVDVRTDLGRDLVVATSDADHAPRSLDELAAFDVVALVEPVTAPGALLAEWIDTRGGGVLHVSPAGSDAPLLGAIEWEGPPEIVPLPEADVGLRGRPATWPDFARGVVDVPVARSADGTLLARTGWLGGGRLYATTLPTWSWVMEAGRTAEHRRYWESVVEWLAGGAATRPRLVGPAAIEGVAWAGRLEGSFTEAELLPPDAVRFLPAAAGAHVIDGPEEAASVGIGVAAADAPLTWTDAALLIGSAGGSIDAADPSASTGETPLRPGGRLPLRVGLFLLLALLAGTAWTVRRTSGLA